MNGMTDACGAVLVAEDDGCLRALLQSLLESAGFGVTSVADGAAAVDAGRTRPLAAVLDVDLPGVSGYEVCRALRVAHGDSLPIVFVSGERTEPFDRVAGLMLGADDYLSKPFAPDELVARLRTLIRRVSPRPETTLTPRELEVLTLLAEGLEQADIAGRLVISSKTVATHLDRILGKLGVRSRAQAVAAAYRGHLVSPSWEGARTASPVS